MFGRIFCLFKRHKWLQGPLIGKQNKMFRYEACIRCHKARRVKLTSLKEIILSWRFLDNIYSDYLIWTDETGKKTMYRKIYAKDAKKLLETCEEYADKEGFQMLYDMAYCPPEELIKKGAKCSVILQKNYIKAPLTQK